MRLLNLTFAVCLFAGPAFASCNQADMQGHWNVYSVGVISDTAYWIKCSVTLESDGTVAQDSSTCLDNNAGGKTHLSGKVSLKSASLCTYSGTVTYTHGSLVSKISEATLSRDHDTVAGVGIFKGGAFSLSMIRN